MQRIQRQMEFLKEIDRVKSILRQTVLMDGSRRENDAEHCWHMAVAAMLFAEYANEPVNMLRVLRMALLHDAIEIYSGDTYVYDAPALATQQQRERQAAEQLFGLLPKDQKEEFLTLWEEFEQNRTPEAKFARAMDCFMPMYHNYVTQGKKWKEHGVKHSQVLARAQKYICPGSQALWELEKKMLEDAVRKGYLREG